MTGATELLREATRIHVMPIDDLREHDDSVECWCKPTEDDMGVVLHHSMDGREAFERGERLPS